ncbi:hypothetical protein [Ramlibacter sp. WS9]|uniref:hypothetical protein n=1 Tax=Ramlibacter sp. WS9 TaxID=1882741 RepID=UPI00116D5FD9|nr:hypothetical protein [Ramlibacter sp. WS9]ROZ77026.1 hypothetical protein EEB15_10605 [Ramlibacter sp. WS9]
MIQIEEFVDERQKSWCIHCGDYIVGLTTNWDHAPTESLLDEPIPPGLPKVRVCKPCNEGFSSDEEYFRTFLSCVLSGTTAPEGQKNSKVRRALARRPALGVEIEAGKREFSTLGGGKMIIWQPDAPRVERVVMKNARGHAFYEMGEPMLEKPDHVWVMPLVSLSREEVDEFENVATSGWAEVGSRMMVRQITGADLDDGWVVVQDNVYRYAVLQRGGLTVRSVIRNYLATEVHWN